MKLLILLLVITSCVKNESDEKENNQYQNMDGLRIQNLRELEGMYRAECQEILSQQNVFGLGFLKFEPNNENQIELFIETGYSNTENCNNGYMQGKLRGSISLNTNRNKMKVTAIEAGIKPLSENLALKFNQQAQCQIVNWQAGVYRSILYTNCLNAQNQIDYYVQSKDEDNNVIVLYSCLDGQPLNAKCERIEYRKL